MINHYYIECQTKHIKEFNQKKKKHIKEELRFVSVYETPLI